MSEAEILENNKAIAEFMNLKSAFAHVKDDFGYTQTVDGFIKNDFEIPYALSDLKYHTSFDWLMPVVEKIEGTGYEFSIFANSCSIFSKRIGNWEISEKSDTKLSATYQAVCEFIKTQPHE